MMYPLVREPAVDGIPVKVTCRVLGFSKQAFYAWCKRPYSDRDWGQAHLINAIYDIHNDDPEFGYRFIADELSGAGFDVCENRVQRLCQQEKIWSSFTKKARCAKKPGPPVRDDLIERDFTAQAPNSRWVGDITEHPTSEGKLYLCVFKDLWSNKIVGYSIQDRMTAALAVSALHNAARRRDSDVAGVIVHTDRGSQFRSRAFGHALNNHAMVGSMGQVGAAGDNASAESFFALLQNNVLNRQRWDTREELRIAIVTWIERTYHRRRRQRTLGKLTPIEFETINQPALQAA